jgi:nucleotide-binding universal stress UspA family protein
VVPDVTVGVDGSEASRQGLEWAIRHAAALDLSVRIVRVVDVADDLRELVPATAVDAELEAAERALMKTIHDLSGEVPGLTTAVIPGHVGTTLVQAAAESECLVVGSRGHSPPARILLGSVSYYAASHAPCPVIVVPPNPLG